MNNTLYIRPEYLQEIKQILHKRLPETAQVLAYGSRVVGNYHNGSDLDLAIENIVDYSVIDELKDDFSYSNIPILIDIHLLNRLPQLWQENIKKQNTPIDFNFQAA